MRVGITIPIGERGPQLVPVRYHEMRELAQAAEGGGLDSIWVPDHLFIRGSDDRERGLWESLSVLGALAEATSRVELGPLVLCTPFRNPGMIAWAANTLDEISGGRFVLGLGAGWHEPEFAAFGFEFNRRVSVLADSLAVLAPLLRDGRVGFAGRWARGEATLRPRASRPGGPPILMAGSGPRMLALTARWADRWNSVWYGLPTDQFREERRRLEQACRDTGRDPAGLEVSVGIGIADPAAGRSRPDSIVGRERDIRRALTAWREEGIAEVMCRLESPSTAAIETIAGAAVAVRGGTLS